MVRTEVKISMKKKYSAGLYFKLLKSYPNKYIYSWKKQTAIEWDYGSLHPSSIKGLPTDKNV
jgi:hypothetical protein